MCFAALHDQVILTVDNQVLLIFVFLCKNNFAFAEMFADFVDEIDWTQGMQKSFDSIRNLVDFHNDVKRWVKFEIVHLRSVNFSITSCAGYFPESAMCSASAFVICLR